MEKSRVHLLIKGRVQGVAFRYATINEANALGVSGWVRNLRNGDVECEAEGDRELLEKLVKWCHDGPPHARVDEVSVRWSDFTGEFTKFVMARTV